jgi:iron complex transport system ATP-binding protein
MGAAANIGQAVIEARAISARIGARKLFEDASCALYAGRILAVLGPNGSGKTTLLRILLGTLKPSSGLVLRHGIVGYVPQRTETAFAYKVRDIVAMGRVRHRGVLQAAGPRDSEIVEQAAARANISNFLDRTFDTLSGGERQLVLVARALASEPRALVLDEPAAALDLKHQAGILALLLELARDENLAVIFTTHHPQHAAAIADDAILMRDGVFRAGSADILLATENLRALYDVPILRLPLPDGNVGRTTIVAAIEPSPHMRIP